MGIKVFVHLNYGLAAEEWMVRFKDGKAPDRVPYGYHHAEGEGYILNYSKDHKESILVNRIRRKLCWYLKFDFIHAWRNRRGIFSSDVVWTHLESEHLAIATLFSLIPRSKRAKLIAQSVWLFDDWNRFSKLRRFLYRILLRQADVLTVHSPANLEVAATLLPDLKSQLVHFGVSLDSFPFQPVLGMNKFDRFEPTRVLAMGNDVHRDYGTLLKALINQEDIELRIASWRVDLSSISETKNVQVVRPSNVQEIKALYSWADLVVVPLTGNLHASGITVILEAVAMGVPVICSDTGGLKAYFSDNEVNYVTPGDAELLRQTVLELAADYEKATKKAMCAQTRFYEADFSSRGYALRHNLLSAQLLGRA